MRRKLTSLIGLALFGLLAFYGYAANLPLIHQTQGGVVVRGRVDQVWGVLTSFQKWPRWYGGAYRAQLGDDLGGERPRVLLLDNHRRQMEIRVVQWEENHLLELEISGSGLPYQGSWRFDLAQEGAATRVTLVEKGAIRPPMYRFFARYVFGYDTTLKGFLKDLNERMNQGP